MEEEIEITQKGREFVKDLKFLKYNKKNSLVNLLQAEQHVKAMNTLNFIEGEGSCVLKHLLFIQGELSEAMAHTSSQLKKGITLEELDELPIFEKLHKEIETFLTTIEGKHNYHKRDLINLVRGWRKEIEKTMPKYRTFNCKCLHSIPYFKQLGLIGFGAFIGVIIAWLV